jgi:citronellol/citronellal dehydrogenase
VPISYRPGLFDGKRVLVSGAGTGFGKAIAMMFARLGADLVICGRRPEKLEAAAKLFEAQGAQVDIHAMTIRDPEQVEAMLDATFADPRGLDIMVNNAGGQFAQPAIDIPVKGWNAVIDTNLNGTWYMMQGAARHWRDNGRPGNIINIVAVIWRGNWDMVHTSASRAGVIYASKTVAVEWAQYGIRTNCVAPGCCESDGFNNYSEEVARAYQNSNPLLHAGDVLDVAETVLYLAAPSGKFINGEVISVDGGQQLWGEVWAFEKPGWTKVD